VHIPFATEAPEERLSVLPATNELTGNETILVVEDEQALLDVISRILRGYGYSVLSAAMGGDALLQCEKFKEPIQLLLVDVVMPRLNGAELAERLQRVHPEMEILFMSGYSDFTVVRQVMSKHIDRFIPKPFSAKDLATKVREVLHNPMAPPSAVDGGRPEPQ
jgi:two-component system, cell cycle sensor histidine kinase and response regulator CckA